MLLFAALLCVLIVLPLAWLVVYAFRRQGASRRSPTFARCSPIPTFLEPLLTTLTIATSVGVVCCLVAAPMAWLVGAHRHAAGATPSA